MRTGLTILTAISLLYVACPAQADPISVVGINILQSQQERDAIATSRGFTCGDNTYPSFDETKVQIHECLKDQAVIRFMSDSIIFSCSVFNRCNATMRKVAEEIVTTGILPTVHLEFNGPSRDFPSGAITFCEEGTDGDVLCGEPTPDGNLRLLELKMGNIGKPRGFN
ncbi:hypothetical protein [Rhizobium sp. BK176]|uniref:hypothetical protein n=1 Tax=Rhizobium sp. BK176 TaxID=2587071 RepID=UPI002167874B|nr:hypothetical protein [Rhizobium sp. BK176]MCS4096104.1 hypothetical protein [Rhizobium sp. BK176]